MSRGPAIPGAAAFEPGQQDTRTEQEQSEDQRADELLDKLQGMIPAQHRQFLEDLLTEHGVEPSTARAEEVTCSRWLTGIPVRGSTHIVTVAR